MYIQAHKAQTSIVQTIKTICVVICIASSHCFVCDLKTFKGQITSSVLHFFPIQTSMKVMWLMLLQSRTLFKS